MAEKKEVVPPVQQADMGDFNIPDAATAVPPPAQPAPGVPQMPPQEAPPVQLPISNEDKDKYFNCIITNQPFHEELTVFNGKLKVGMRTRTVQESEAVLKFLNKMITSKEIDFYPDFQNKHVMGHVAFAVTSLNGKNIDAGDLEARLKRITSLDNQLFIILIEMLKRFDEKMQRLRDEALKPNF
jgi:hypothetical protein